MLDEIRVLILTLKYWLNGDTWQEAKAFAEFIVNRWE